MAKTPGYIVLKAHDRADGKVVRKPLTDGVDVILFAEREDANPYVEDRDHVLRLVRFRKPRGKQR